MALTKFGSESNDYRSGNPRRFFFLVFKYVLQRNFLKIFAIDSKKWSKQKIKALIIKGGVVVLMSHVHIAFKLLHSITRICF